MVVENKILYICFQDGAMQIWGGFLIKPFLCTRSYWTVAGFLCWWLCRGSFSMQDTNWSIFLLLASVWWVSQQWWLQIVWQRGRTAKVRSPLSRGEERRGGSRGGLICKGERSKCRGSGNSFVLKEKRRRHAAICFLSKKIVEMLIL